MYSARVHDSTLVAVSHISLILTANKIGFSNISELTYKQAA